MRRMAWLTTLVACAAAALADPYRPCVGQRHPDFTLPAIEDGKPVSLSGLRGRKVLLVHFASW